MNALKFEESIQKYPLLSFLLILMLIFSVDHVDAYNISNCTIIDSPGVYVLIENVTDETSTCIQIISNDVVFDGNGYTIDGVDSLGTYGIYVHNLAIQNVTIKNVIITDWEYGVVFEHVNNSEISNIIGNSNEDGIYLHESSLNTLNNNTLSSNSCGIVLQNSSFSNIITNNTITDNNIGIHIKGFGGEQNYPLSQYNTIYLNRFINNTNNAFDDSPANYWNSSEIKAYTYQGNDYTNYTGNYWDDYSGVDANGDGIGDTPYNIPASTPGIVSRTKDYYPMLFETKQPPSITNIQESNLTNSSITITWQTDILSDNRILYSLNPDLSSATWSNWNNNTQNPSITLTGLSANTTYYYSAYSYRSDNTSLYSNSSIRNFTTIRSPKTWYVDDDGNDCTADFTTIQDAVNASIDGDTIIVCSGTYVENVLVNKSLNITGIDNPVVDANQMGSGFTLASNGNVVQGFTIKNGAYFGGNYWGKGAGVRIGNTTYYTIGWTYYRTHHSSANNIVRNNHFINNSYGVLIIPGSDNNQIIQNTFENSGVTIFDDGFFHPENNSISNNLFNLSVQKTAIEIKCEIVSCQMEVSMQNSIKNNTINRTASTLLPLISIESKFNDNTISDNYIVGTGKSIRVSSKGNKIVNNTIIGAEELSGMEDIGIELIGGRDNSLINNSVELKYVGICIQPYSPSQPVNITMRDNTMANNSYHFYIDPPSLSINSPTYNDFDMDIDTSNLIHENGIKRIYYVRSAHDTVYNSQEIGFFACINCNNITLKFLSLQKNSHGVLLYNTSNSSIDAVNAYNNHLAGMAIYDSRNISIKDSWITSSGQSNYGSGLYLGRSENITVNNTDIETNWCYGIKFEESNNNTITNSNITDNGPSYYLPPTTNPCQTGYGLYFHHSELNTIKNNYIFSTFTPKRGQWEGGQKYGIYLYFSNNNTICNNYFNNTINARDNGNNTWNISKTPTTNIINGPYLGGNYWHDYAGMDTVGGDGLGDTLLPYNSSGNIANGGDYLPLTNVAPDYTAPTIYVVSPEEGKTYSANYVYLRVHSPDPDVNKWWYSLNSGSNVSFIPNTTITGLSNGDYSLTVYVNDTAGNTNFSTVNFSIRISPPAFGGGVSGITPPVLEEVKDEEIQIQIEITTPESKSYTERFLTLAFTSSSPLRRASYILDDSPPVAVSLNPYATSGSVEIERLSLGEHRIVVNGEDYYGLRGKDEIKFKIIPLTLGEVLKTGTPKFMDDVAFSFFGRKTDYTLTFEARGEGKMDVYLNKFYRNRIKGYNNLSGYLITTIQLNGWQTYEIPVSGDNVTSDVENIIAFISENAGNGGTRQWEIKNVSLIPSLPFNFPQIKIFTFDKSISEKETMTAYVEIDGVINESKYDAYIYLLTPDGRKLYYPDWTEDEKPIKSYYLRTNYYGKFPSILEFNNSFSIGTYILVGKIADEFNTTISLSTDKVYYNNQTSVKLYINRETLIDGQKIIIEHMLTGNATQNGTLLLSMENPDGEQIYLPMLSTKAEEKEYRPIRSDYFIALEEMVNGWKEGTYIVRSNLFSNNGELIAEDIQTYDVCRRLSSVEGAYLRNITDNDTSAFILSRIRLIDFYTLEVKEEEFKGEHYGYSIAIPPGKYYLTGEAYSNKGEMYHIPMIKLTLKCGENQTRNVKLEHVGSINLSSYGYESLASSFANWKVKDQSCPLKFEEESNRCSKPKVFVTLILSDDAVDLLQSEKEYKDMTAEEIKRSLSIKLAQMLKSVSNNVEIFSYGETAELLDGVKSYLEENPGANPDISKLSPIQQIEYIYLADIIVPSLSHYEFFIHVYLTERMTNKIVMGPIRLTGSYDIEDDLAVVVNHYGDIGATIEDWENSHPFPPRDPKMYIAVIPGSISAEEREAEIRVTVTDCKNRPIFLGYGARYDQKVFFQRYTDRGEVKDTISYAATSEEGLKELKNFVISYVYKNSVAKATYKLIKGIGAGEDKVKIITYGRGMKKVIKFATIKINGIKVEIKPNKNELAPKQETLITISLYEESEEGVKTPIGGKPVIIDDSYLRGGKLAPLGTTDAYGNPLTDENGKIILKFIAGKKEGLVKIPVKYRTELGEVHDNAFIKVRKEEFIINIRWSSSCNWGSLYVRPWYKSYAYAQGTLNFNTKIIWDRISKKETLSESFFFEGIRSDFWEEKMAWLEDEYRYSMYCYKIYDLSSGITSDKIGIESYRSIILEDKKGNLVVSIDPLGIYLPLEGAEHHSLEKQCTYTKDGYSADSWGYHKELDFDFRGVVGKPYPSRIIDCIRASHPYLRIYYGKFCRYHLSEGFPNENVLITKTGDKSYSSFHFSVHENVNYVSDQGVYLFEFYYEGYRDLHIVVVKR